MERLNNLNSNLNPNFIGSWTLDPISLCDELIDYFEANISLQRKGSTSGGVHKETKDSVDITVLPREINLPGNEVFIKYFEKLFECHKDYIIQWPFLKTVALKYEIGCFNIQRYMPGQHFKRVHTERASIQNLHRVFAFMTYLNDVQEGGSTYFSHYDLDIQPKKGLTLIWPAEWTHAHKGNILKQGSKYIITGWLNFTAK